MLGLGAQPRAVHAVLGPSIGAASYEVGPGFPTPFLARRPQDEDLFAPAGADGRFLFDLAGYVARRLRRLGLGRGRGDGRRQLRGGRTFLQLPPERRLWRGRLRAQHLDRGARPVTRLPRASPDMPYAIILSILLFVGLVASCVLAGPGP